MLLRVTLFLRGYNIKIKLPPRLSSTPPKEGNTLYFPSFGGVPIGWGGF
jgi:hypothetical protein